MQLVFRSLFAVLFVCGFALSGAAQEYSVNTGEIRFDGTLISFDEAGKTLVLNVTSFTLPTGKSSQLAAPKPKTILLTPTTKIEVAGQPGTSATALMKAGAAVVVIAQDAGSGKDTPARLVLVRVPAASTPAAPAASTPAVEGADPNELVLRAGEVRFDARLTGILSATNLTASVFSVTNAAGETTELFPTQSKTVLLDAATPLRSRGDATRKMTVNDLEIGARISFVGTDGGARIKAREIAVWEADKSSTESIGSVSVSGIVSVLLGRAEQAMAARAYEEAIRTLNRSLESADGIGGRGLTLDYLGNVYDEMNQPQKALSYYQSALAIWRGLGDTQSESTTLNNLGILQRKMGEPEKAVETLERAVQLARGGDPRGVALTLQNLVGAYMGAEKTDKALATALEALPVVRQTRKTADAEAVLLARIAQLYGASENTPKALEYAAQVVALVDQMQEKDRQAYVLMITGSAYQHGGQKEKALEYFKRAQTLYAELGQDEAVKEIEETIAKM